jgi:hypothetical protein
MLEEPTSTRRILDAMAGGERLERIFEVRGAEEVLGPLGSTGDKVLVEGGWKSRSSATRNCFGLACTFHYTTSLVDSSEALGQRKLN